MKEQNAFVYVSLSWIEARHVQQTWNWSPVCRYRYWPVLTGFLFYNIEIQAIFYWAKNALLWLCTVKEIKCKSKLKELVNKMHGWMKSMIERKRGRERETWEKFKNREMWYHKPFYKQLQVKNYWPVLCLMLSTKLLRA